MKPKLVFATGNLHEDKSKLSHEDKFELLSLPEKQKRVDEYDAKERHWYGFCRHCGFRIHGTMEVFFRACPNCGKAP